MKLEVTTLFSEPRRVRKLVEYEYKGKKVLSLNDKGVTVSGPSYPEPVIYIFADSMLVGFFDPDRASYELSPKENRDLERYIIASFKNQLIDSTIHELIHGIFAEDDVNEGTDLKSFDPAEYRISKLHHEITMMATKLATSS
jgi:hypothetical protein